MTRTELMVYAQQTYDTAISNHRFIRFERLNKCKAHYVDCGTAVILKSYDTVVAIYHRRTGTLYVFDRYSTTTVQHVSKFIKMLKVYRITYLYERSDGVLEIVLPYTQEVVWFKPTKQEWKNLQDYDFSMEITNRWD